MYIRESPKKNSFNSCTMCVYWLHYWAVHPNKNVYQCKCVFGLFISFFSTLFLLLFYSFIVVIIITELIRIAGIRHILKHPINFFFLYILINIFCTSAMCACTLLKWHTCTIFFFFIFAYKMRIFVHTDVYVNLKKYIKMRWTRFFFSWTI